MAKDLLTEQRLKFVGELPIPDGGSYVFHFVFPNGRELAVQVLHRHDYLGGNPKFQEIRLDRSGTMQNYLALQPGSELEKKLLALLSTAKCDTNGTPLSGWALPTTQRLKWLSDRIQDRASTW